MPWGDRTGPLGAGPRTGRGLGFCSGYATPGYLNAGFGRGFGYGRGRGFGFGARWGYGYDYAAVPTKEEERSFLEAEIQRLTNGIESLKKRLDELKD